MSLHKRAKEQKPRRPGGIAHCRTANSIAESQPMMMPNMPRLDGCCCCLADALLLRQFRLPHFSLVFSSAVDRMSRNARLLSFLKRQPKFWRCRQLTILALLSHLCSSLVSPRTFYRSLVPASPSADGNSKKNKPPQILVFPRPPCFIHVAESRALTLGAGGEGEKKKQIGRGRGPSRTTPCSPSCRQPHQRSVPGNPVTGSLFLIKQLWPTNRL